MSTSVHITLFVTLIGSLISFCAQAQEPRSTNKLNEAEQRALDSKRAARDSIAILPPGSRLPETSVAEASAAVNLYARYAVGQFMYLESIRLRWLTLRDTKAPDYFALVPRKNTPFAFRRPNTDEIITPRHMFTDGGSVPWLVQSLPNLSPWGYGPAYLIHDYLFDLHHCQSTKLDFETARDIMMEALKTLMETGLSPKSEWTFWAIYQGINGSAARQYWTTHPSDCTLPPDLEE